MGVALSWIAARGLGKADMLGALGLVEVQADIEPSYVEHWMADLPSGWTLFQAKDFMFPKPERMAAISAAGEAIACSIEEHVMYSVVRGYVRGQAVWSVDHDGGKRGVYHLDVAGSPPPEFAVLRDKLKAKQDEEGGLDARADYMFELPAELSDALCGYAFEFPASEGFGVHRAGAGEDQREGRVRQALRQALTVRFTAAPSETAPPPPPAPGPARVWGRPCRPLRLRR